MAMEFAHGAVQWLAADGVGTNYTISSLSFQPKAIRFYWVGIGSATDAASQTISSRRGVGFAVSTSSRRAIGSFSEDSPTASNCGGVASDDCIACTTDGAGARDGLLDITAFNSDGFVLTVDDAAPADITVFWEAWGGADITLAAIGDIAEPAATGNQDYTVTGFVAGATDQIVMFAGCQSTAALNTAQATDSGMCAGFASGGSAAENATICGNSDDASNTMDADQYGIDGECLSMITISGGNPNARAQLTQFGTDNFRLNWIARGTTNRRYVFLAIKGGNWRVGGSSIASQTTNATTTISGLPFTPIGLSLISVLFAKNAAGTARTYDEMAFGTGTSTTSRRSMCVADEDATATAEIDTCIEYDQVMVIPSVSGTVDGAWDISQMNSDGFQLIVDNAGVNSNIWFGYLTFGSLVPTRGRISFAELEVPSVPTRGRVSWVELEVPTVQTRGRVSFAEFEVPDASLTPTRGRVSFAELEVPNVPTPTRGRVSWTELETPFVATRGRVSWAELEVPTTLTRGRVSWVELEVPLAPTRGRASWLELEVPSVPTRGRVSWAELEVPATLTRGRVSWVELEIPLAPTRGRASWLELEVPSAPTRGRVSWLEFEVPEVGGPDEDPYFMNTWNQMFRYQQYYRLRYRRRRRNY